MKISILILIIYSFTHSVQASYIESFDSASLTNDWTYGYGTSFAGGLITWTSSGGNPDGNFSGAVSNLYAIWPDSAAAYGEFTGLTMTLDIKVDSGSTGLAQFYVGRGGEYYVAATGWDISTSTTWTTYALDLNAVTLTAWGSPSVSLAYVLESPEDIGIFFGGSVATGSGDIYVDNFGVIPEPAVLSLILLSSVGSLALKRFWS